jgi:hypothetical protein
MGVVVDDEGAVDRPVDVELDPVGTEGDGPGEGGDGVLGMGGRGPAMGDDQGFQRQPPTCFD